MCKSHRMLSKFLLFWWFFIIQLKAYYGKSSDLQWLTMIVIYGQTLYNMHMVLKCTNIHLRVAQVFVSY